MRQVLTHLALGLLLVTPLIGCNLLRDRRDQPPPPPPLSTDKAPDAASLVNYLNQNAKLVQSVVAKVDMDCKADGQRISLAANMACEKPRDFRLKAVVLGQSAADIGSNDREFWYWIAKAQPPYLYHCSYENLKTGKVRVPFPFQPDMVLTALGIADYNPRATYQVKPSQKTVELIQDDISPTGQPVKKIVVFNRYMANQPGQPQVVAYAMRDARGNLICQAHVKRVQVDRTTKAVLPTKVLIEWPSQKMSMEMFLSDLQVNSIDKPQAAALFSRTGLSYTAFDLARGAADSPTGLQRAGAVVPRK
jgi:hypothetical protein